jgi:hypothetical protein
VAFRKPLQLLAIPATILDNAQPQREVEANSADLP